ncbi:MAG: hypothetical protein A2359_03400 [Candidatus Moranbacteria bacterium RIFOXYB1_FULL_43_19]|nr:MAG: hypothetical protein A2359_03400 [Candidatus Moranbacteria bacterium RIFOXYB1_FULL_43_19]OGI27927.1 MAG: hypothetical protein A2184_02840 [Candidatus Moranbacteria bacterium RIFOXYA1_FULL_44_7]OGI32543.1 MAG: hypothetical protein A2420_03135 [Candidatus Moranbacteria bacterium RIFOXYC1_FULL_44_13]
MGNKIVRIAVAPKHPKEKEKGVYTIYNLEIAENEVPKIPQIFRVLHDAEVEEIFDVGKLQAGDFHEVMYKNAIIDPQAQTIGKAFEKLGVRVEALKVGKRYYGEAFKGVYVNPNVEISFSGEPNLDTLKPEGFRPSMDTYDLSAMGEEELFQLSQNLNLSLSLKQMQAIRQHQIELGLPYTTDLDLDVYAILWCDHCRHIKWEEWGHLLGKLRRTTEEIANPNVVSAFIDNAGGWAFYDDTVLVFGAETHNSPSRKWTFGGQITKILGHFRDIFMYALGAKPIGVCEMTTVGEFVRKKFPILGKYFFPESQVARETIEAVAKAGNTTGVPMLLARMYSHPAYGVKPFAFGGTLGITTRKAALKGVPQAGDLAVLVGGKTGNDGYHGGTVASMGLDKAKKAEDHVQIGDPYTQQKMMPAIIRFRDSGCTRAKNDFGAGGFISAFGEMTSPKIYPWGSYSGGLILNFAPVPLKCAQLPFKIIAIGESQERFAFIVIPGKLQEFIEICELFELEWTVVGVCTGNGRLQIVYDENIREYTKDMLLSGQILFDRPYELFENCPMEQVEIIEPPAKNLDVKFPEITPENVEDMAEKVVGHFDNCNQSRARLQYDSTVQGISVHGPQYGENYNVGSHLAVEKPLYGKPYGVTVSMSFNPWLLEADPVAGAFSSVLDAYVAHIVAGVHPLDIGLVDNFYTPHLDPYAPWYVVKQVDAICEFSKATGAPFINGKDSNYGAGEFEGQTICIPPSVNIMAVGKIENVKNMTLHQWEWPGNLLFSLGRRSISLAGSTLASALGISGGRVSVMPTEEIKQFVEKLHKLSSRGIFQSAVPVNRGGLFLRLFEGVEASSFGVETNLCQELFPESYGTVLVEVDPGDAFILEQMFRGDAMFVGRIVNGKSFSVRGRPLNWERLFDAWNTRFEKEVYGNG